MYWYLSCRVSRLANNRYHMIQMMVVITFVMKKLFLSRFSCWVFLFSQCSFGTIFSFFLSLSRLLSVCLDSGPTEARVTWRYGCVNTTVTSSLFHAVVLMLQVITGECDILQKTSCPTREVRVAQGSGSNAGSSQETGRFAPSASTLVSSLTLFFPLSRPLSSLS